jgi:hypothetical protein
MKPFAAGVQWLDTYFTQNPPYVAGDDLATSFLSVEAVLLASMVLNTWRPKIIAEVTRFPVPFIAAVLQQMSAKDLWHLPAVLALGEDLRGNCANQNRIRCDLSTAMEFVWDAVAVPEAVVAFESLRMRTLYRCRLHFAAVLGVTRRSSRRLIGTWWFVRHDQYTTIVRSKPSQVVLNHLKARRPQRSSSQ